MSASTACLTCNSSNRNFRVIRRRHRNILNMILPELHDCRARACWECVAVVARLARFRDDALAVQRELYLHNVSNESKSRLATSSVTIVSFPSEPQTNTGAIDNNLTTEDESIDAHAQHESSEGEENNTLAEIKVKMMHQEKIERDTSKKIKATNSEKAKDYICKVCGDKFKSRGQFEYHKERHREKPQCETCGKTFISKSALWLHRQMTHGADTHHYKCGACGKTQFTAAGHAAHVASHADDSRLYCALCNKFFKTRSTFRKHTRTATRHRNPMESRYGCPNCERKFETEEQAKRHHDVIHLQKNKLACQQCNREYCTARALRIHVRMKHENVTLPRDKVCEVCGKGFTNLQVLKSHMRTHTGQRPYKCAVCQSAFAQSGALHTHVRLVHLKVKRKR